MRQRAIGLVLLSVAAATLSACSIRPTHGETTLTSVLTRVPFSTAGTTERILESARATQPPLTLPDDLFAAEARQIIQDALAADQREISLKPLFVRHRVSEADIQQTIDFLFEQYQAVYYANPQFIILNGSFSVHYYVQQTTDPWISEFKIQPGIWEQFADLDKTQLDELRRRVKAEIETLTQNTAAAAPDDVGRLTVLHDALIRRIAYSPDSDPRTNTIVSALLDGVSMCQGYAQTFQWVTQNLGLDVRLIMGSSAGIGHAWNLVLLNGQPYHIDVTHDDPLPDSGSAAPVLHRHMFRSDAVMQTTHTWDASAFPAADRDGAFYYHQNDLVIEDRAALQARLNRFMTHYSSIDPATALLEVMYSGTDCPNKTEWEEIVKTSLRQLKITDRMRYRADAGRLVLSLELIPT